MCVLRAVLPETGGVSPVIQRNRPVGKASGLSREQETGGLQYIILCIERVVMVVVGLVVVVIIDASL